MEDRLEIDIETQHELLDYAKKAMHASYSPYSHFPVGAAVLMSDGKVYTGCNVENANYTSTICAERTAFVKAISEGRKDFEMVAVACNSDMEAWPCGLCRQFMSEFGEDIAVIIDAGNGKTKRLTLGQLLPERLEPAAG